MQCNDERIGPQAGTGLRLLSASITPSTGRRLRAALVAAAALGLAVSAWAARPEPTNWFVGDLHVHRSCGGNPVPLTTISNAMVAADLMVLSLQADMGNGEVLDPATDLPLVNGNNSPASPPGRIIRWDAEWHWDPVYWQFPHQVLGGHILAMGITNAVQRWDEYTAPVLSWARNQGGVAGFAHLQYLPNHSFPTTLDCCAPLEYPVEVALGNCDFISQDVAGGDAAMFAYYRLLNCGFRPGWGAGSDYPCNAQIGALVTYVQVDGPLTYRKWIDGLAAGKTVISRNGRSEFLNLKVNTNTLPGGTLNLPAGGGTVQVSVEWSASQAVSGQVEIVRNGVVVTNRTMSLAADGKTNLTINLTFTNSGWVVARRMGNGEHRVHTAAAFVTVNNQPIRASAADAQFYVNWMDQLLSRTSPGGAWASYFNNSRADAQARYQAARAIFAQIAQEAGSIGVPAVPVKLGNAVDGFVTDNIYENGPWINAARFQATNNASVNAIFAKVGAVAGRYKTAIYTDSSGQPAALLRGSYEVVGPSDGWYQFALTNALTLNAGQSYWLAIWSDDPQGRIYYSGYNGATRWQKVNYGNWPASLATTGGGDHNFCIFAADLSQTVTNLSVTPGSATMAAGNTQALTATATYSDGSSQNVTAQAAWATSNAAVATVSGGVVTGVAPGSAAIAASFGGRTGTAAITVTPSVFAAGDYRTVAGGNWNQTNIWERFNGSAWVAATTTPTAANAGLIEIRAGHVVTVTNNVTVDQVRVLAAGQLLVGAATLTVADGDGTDLEVLGLLGTTSSTSAAFTLNSGATIAVQDGGVYRHGRNGGTLPTATWHPNSTCEITGMTSSYPGGMDQTFGHVVFNSDLGTSSTAVVMANDLTTAGDLTITNSGSRPFQGTASGAARTLSVGGNFLMRSGSFVLKAGAGNAVLNVAGNCVQTGGTLTLRSGSASGTAEMNVAGAFTLSGGTLDLSAVGAVGNLNVAGHFTHTGGTLTESSTGSGQVTFNGSAPQVFTSGGTVSQTVNFTVAPGAFLQMADAGTVVGGAGVFTLSDGAGLGITSPNGITSGTGTGGTAGNIRTSGGRTFGLNAHYRYNGASAQVTGSGLPTNLAASGSVTFANPAGVSLSANLTGAGPALIATNGLLASTGSLAGPLTIAGAVAPGGSPGTLASGAQTWSGGGVYRWELSNATGAPGAGYDQLSAGASPINITATATNPFILKLVTLNGGSPGLAANFNLASNYVWTIATGGGITGFAPDRVVIDASEFQNPTGAGVFALEQSGGNLRLRYSYQLGIATTTLPVGATNQAYAATLTASGGLAPLTWSVIGGALPPGLSINSGSGVISGTPTMAGPFNFTVQVADSSVPPETATRALAIAVTQPAPILILTNAANPFTAYYPEILLTEGLNSFALGNISNVSASLLAPYDIVLLGEMALSTAQANTLSNWVAGGGKLIAFRPDNPLSGLFGLVNLGSTLSEGYLRINTSNGPGVGIVGETIQYHGTANRYRTNGATVLATLFSNATTATTNPAVTLRSFGTNGGQAAAFAFDLARSIALTRQGNPAWAGQERDGFPPLRSSDLFFPDWVNLDKVAIPQADEQQRFLANLIAQMNSARRQLPRFWYFPDEHKAAIVMTGDDHANNGTAGRFDQYLAYSGTNTLVDEWKTVRGTSYIFPDTRFAPNPLTPAQASNYVARGFEIALHCNSNCTNYTDVQLQGHFATQLSQLAANFPGLPAPVTHRMHCIAWSGYTILPEVGLQFGIRLDTSYYYWPSNWVQNRPGLFTGSGMPMRFVRTNGVTLDVYQAATQMTDESGQSYPFTADALLDRALGPEGYYGFFVANMHTDVNPFPMSDAIVMSALNRGVPIITAKQLLDWWDGRNASTIQPVLSTTNQEVFHVTANALARGLQVMVPVPPGRQVSAVRYNGTARMWALKQIKGMVYAQFPAPTGLHEVDFAPDTTPPAIVSTSPANGQTGVKLDAVLRVQFAEPLDPATVTSNALTLVDHLANTVPLQVTYDANKQELVGVPQVSLQLARTYTATVTAGSLGVRDVAGNALTTPASWSFATISQALYSIWPPSATPSLLTDPDPNATEVGVKFRSATNGYITALRYYRGPANPGPHIGSLWTSGGTKLASVTFSNETATGWQEQALPAPVAIPANTTYIASYHAPQGGYSTTPFYFASQGATNGPLRALSDAEAGGNGVYKYGPAMSFPNLTYNSENYWVDVVFTTALASNTPPVAGSMVVTLPEDGSTNFFLLGSDAQGPVTFALLTAPTNGVLSGINTNTGAVTYTPAPNYFGPDHFTYRVSDGSLFATGTVSITVLPVNDAPVFVQTPTNRTIAELTLLTVTNAATDVDTAASSLTYTLLNPPAGAVISSNGVITWTPTEGQGPSTNVIVTVVSDGQLSVTNQFTVVVTEVNAAPVFVQTPPDVMVAELTLLTVTNAATDADLPANALTYALLDAPVGAVISTNGVITWTPTEGQGPSTNLIATVVSDGQLSVTNQFTVVVTEVNVAPVFVQTPPDVTVAELTLLTVTNTATDADEPANALTYALLDAPAGAVISTNGVITWTPTEGQGPSTNLIVTVVSDGQLSATNQFTVIVTEVNEAPVFVQTPPDVTVVVGHLLTVTNGATDADLPAAELSYVLLNAPAGAVISSAGIVTWTPTADQAPGTNWLVSVVSDGEASATNAFQVVVIPVLEPPVLLSIEMADEGVVIEWSSIAGYSYRLESATQCGAPDWQPVTDWLPGTGGAIRSTNATGGLPLRIYRVQAK